MGVCNQELREIKVGNNSDSNNDLGKSFQLGIDRKSVV